MILSKSPHYIHIDLIYPTTYSITMKLYIWSGDKANEPLNPTYTLTKERPDVEVTALDVDISRLVDDYIEHIPALQNSSGKYTTTGGVWVKYVISYNDDSTNITDTIGIDFAVGGYGYFLEGINPDVPANRSLTPSTLQKADTFFIFPYIADGTISELTVSDGTTTQVYGLTDNQNTTGRLGYLWINTDDFTGEYITVSDGLKEYSYQVVTECKYTPEKIMYLNRYGAYEVFTFFKARKESLEVNSETFRNAYVENGAYDITRHQKQRYATQSEESFSLSTDHIAEEENERIKQLLQSDSVYLIGNNQLIPVNVKTQTLEIKTRINDKLVNYTLEFEYAFNKINQI